MKNLIANKTKMIRLCREYGLEPKKAKCTKAYRNRSWWLDWADSDYSWRVSLMVAGGAPVIGIRRRWYDDSAEKERETWECKEIPLDLAEKLGIIEEIPRERRCRQ